MLEKRNQVNRMHTLVHVYAVRKPVSYELGALVLYPLHVLPALPTVLVKSSP
jgi:hypothetical protein